MMKRFRHIAPAATLIALLGFSSLPALADMPCGPMGFTVVLTEMLSITVVSIVVLLILYRPYEHSILAFVRWTTNNNRNMAVFMFVLFLIPIVSCCYCEESIPFGE